MKILYSLFASLFFFVAAYCLLGETTDEGKNVFASGVYSGFQNQLGLTKKDVAHSQFVAQLREKIKEGDTSVDLLVLKIYGVDLREASEDFLFSRVAPPKPNERLSDYLTTTLIGLKEDKRFNGMEHPPTKEDPFLHGNLPSLQWEFQGGPTLIRMAHPAKDLWFWQRWVGIDPIQPEFRRFLQLEAPKRHLYVNLMKRYGDEGSLSRAIENLENEAENLAVVTLDKNTPFYWQSDEFAEINDAKEFKFNLLKALNGKRYYFSSKLNQFPDRLPDIIESVHSKYFKGSPSLTGQERQDFIEIVYISILDALVNEYKPLTMNISCKQAMDRGPGLALLWIVSREGEKNIKSEAALFLAPPLLIHNRPSHLPRLQRLLSAFSTIQKNIKPLL